MAEKNYRLTVQKGPQEGQSYALVGTMVTVGRDPMADIVITDPEVSRQHVRFTRTDGGYDLQDLGSTNGTFIDGRRLGGESHRLAPGQVITMGSNVSLVYEEVGDQLETVLAPGGEGLFPEAEEEAEALFAEAEDEGDEAEAEAEPEVQIYDFPEVEEADYGTVLEEPAGEEAVDYGTVLEEPAGDEEPVEMDPFGFEEVEADEAATTFDYPSFEEEEEEDDLFGEAGDLPSFDDAGDLPSFDEEEELPDFDETPPPAYGRQILEPEAAQPEEEAEGDLPDFGGVDADFYEAEKDPGVPPAPVPPGASPPTSNRNRNLIIIALVALFVLCCCCLFLILAWNYGDAALDALNQMQ